MALSTLTTRLPAKIIKEIEYWSKQEKIDRSTLLRKLIDSGLREWKIERALEMYRAQKVTLWKAAEIAGISLSELLSELPKRKVIFHYDLDELREDLKYASGK